MTTEEPYNPLDTDATQAAEAESAEAKQRRRIREESDFKWMMQDKRGRRVMWRLLGFTGLHRSPWTAQREATDFNCGMQNVGQMLQAEIHLLCPEQYFAMVKEQQEDERASKRS